MWDIYWIYIISYIVTYIYSGGYITGDISYGHCRVKYDCRVSHRNLTILHFQAEEIAEMKKELVQLTCFAAFHHWGDD